MHYAVFILLYFSQILVIFELLTKTKSTNELKKYGGPAGPLAQTVVAPDAATEGVLSVADATIFCSA